MDNITVIVEDYPQEITVQVEDYPQEITVQVVTTGITVNQANQIVSNTQKVGITTQQASDIVANNAKIGTTLETNGTSGEATLIDGILNIPNYSTSGDFLPLVGGTMAGNINLNNRKITHINELNFGANAYVTSPSQHLINFNQASVEIDAGNGFNSQVGNLTVGRSLTVGSINNASSNTDKFLVSDLGVIKYRTASQLLSDIGAVDSVNGAVGIVVLDTGDIAENTNLYYTEARVSANTDVAANTAKVGITTAQASEIIANNSKVGITTTQASDINTNNAKVGYTDALVSANSNVVANTAKVGITTAQAIAITDNTAKVGYTEAAVSSNTDVAANTAKTGITSAQANEIVANTTKVGITTQQASDITTNNSKIGITTQQASDIVLNNSKVGITTQQSNDIVTNNNKVGITTTQASDITSNNAKVGITVQQASDIVSNNSKVGITTTQENNIIANNAKVSDVNHVTLELPNVDNTSDLNKPISIATQSALDLKVDKTQDEINTQNIFKAVSFAMDFSDRVIADSGILESRECIMNEYLKINI